MAVPNPFSTCDLRALIFFGSGSVSVEGNEGSTRKHNIYTQLFEALQMIEQPPEKTTLTPTDTNDEPYPSLQQKIR
jgi:hypothetical protein